jgi:hypothetical protein
MGSYLPLQVPSLTCEEPDYHNMLGFVICLIVTFLIIAPAAMVAALVRCPLSMRWLLAVLTRDFSPVR